MRKLNQPTKVKHWRTSVSDYEHSPRSVQRAKELVSIVGDDHGIAMVLGIESGELVQSLVKHSSYHIVAFDDDPARGDALRRELNDAGIDSSRAAVITCDMATLKLPPYLATLITTERVSGMSLPPLQPLRPFGGTAAMGPQVVMGDIELKRIQSSEPGAFDTESISGEWIVRRVGPPVGARQYAGDWAKK